MNIFVLDLDPELAAKYHCDKHVVKMILETAQLLCTSHWLYSKDRIDLYKPTHVKHPCTLWVSESLENYQWLMSLFYYLEVEFENRYQHEHLAYRSMYNKLKMPPKGIPSKDLTPFAQAMPEIYKDPDPVKAYRAYYCGEKNKIATWKYPATIPEWFTLNK